MPADILQRHHPGSWPLVAVAFLAAVAFIFLQNESFHRDYARYVAVPPSPSIASLHFVRLTIEFEDGRRRAFEGAYGSGMSALAALRGSGEAGTFDIATNGQGQVVAIAGTLNRSGRQWRWYRNGALMSDLPGHVEVRPGDRLSFRYE